MFAEEWKDSFFALAFGGWETVLLRALQSARLHRSLVQLACDETVEAVNDSAARELGKLHIFFFSGLESYCGSGRDIQPHAICALPVERESGIGFEKMVVAADLDGAVTGISHQNAQSFAPTI